MLQSPFTAFEFYFYDVFKKALFAGHGDLAYNQKFACGALAGMSATLLTHPFDVVKTYTLTQKLSCTKTFCYAYNFISEQGPRKLYSGLSVSMTGIPIFIGLRMATYDQLSSTFPRYAKTDLQRILAHGLAGSVAGVFAVSIYYPLDVLRRIMHLNGEKNSETFANAFDAITKTYQRKGLAGFYRGFTTTLAKQAPMTLIMFSCNNELKKLLNMDQ